MKKEQGKVKELEEKYNTKILENGVSSFFQLPLKNSMCNSMVNCHLLSEPQQGLSHSAVYYVPMQVTRFTFCLHLHV